MVEFSNIFKKNENEPRPKNTEEDKVAFSSLNMNRSKEKSEGLAQSGPHYELKEIENNSEKYIQAKALYEEILNIASMFLKTAVLPQSAKVEEAVKKIIGFTAYQSQELIEVSFNANTTEAHYQALNLLNVCILAVQLGFALGLEDDDILALGIAAFLHDAGMLQYLEMISESRKLNIDEYAKIKEHGIKGRQMLEKSDYANTKNIIEAVGQEHERVDGSGYPEGINADEISEFAKIIGFCDVYEALTHKRPWRGAYDSLRAIKIILKDKGSFERGVIKSFLERIGLCPKGVMVELSTREVARVIRHNPKHPMAPDVDIIYDVQGKRLSQARQVSLSDKAIIYIAKCI